MKKALSILLSICMLLSISAGLDFSAYGLDSSGKCGDGVTYTFNSSSGLLTISGSGAMYDYNSTYSSPYHYTKNPFYDQTSIKTLVINDGVTRIGNYAFLNCSSLTSVEIPNSVTSIGNYAFSGCTILTSIEIPNSVTSIGDSVFSHCSGLTSVEISDSLTSISNYAFYDCSGIKELTMPCSAKIYNSQYTFYNCSNIESVTLTKGTGTMQNYSLSNGESDTFYQYTPFYFSRNNLKEIVIEDGVENIGSYAFEDCSSLTSVEIPNSVTSIGDYAFYRCRSLTSATIGNSVTSIGNYAFSGCTSLTSVEIPNSVTSIGDYAFYGCYSFEVISIPNSVTIIGNYAFYGCSLNYIEIPSSVKTIGSQAVSLYNALVLFRGSEEQWNEISIDSNNSSLNESQVKFCPETKSGRCGTAVSYSYEYENGEGILTISGTGDMINATSAKSGVFYNLCIDKLIIEDGITNIGAYAFMNCVTLNNVSIGSSVSKIGNYAFDNCSSLAGIDIPESVSSIGNYAFFNCKSLTSIEIPNKVTNIGYYAFYGCRSLTSLVIQNGLKSIEYSVFENCSSLTSITIPDSVTSIGNNSFGDCTELKNVDIGTGLASIASAAFSGCNKIERVSLFSKKLSSTQNLVSQMPEGSTLYASKDTDAEVYCGIYGVNFVTLEGMECELNHHTFEQTGTVPPNCTEIGKIIYTCTNCDYSYYDSIEPLGHDYVSKVIAPTCSEKGYTKHTCTRCSDEYTDTETDMIPHTEAVDEFVAPTCLRSGLTEGSHCSVCGKVITPQEEIPKLNHHYTEKDYPANCTQQGFTLHSCIWCGDSFKDNYSEITDHIPSEGVRENDVVPTCIDAGSYDIVVYCSVCHKELSKETFILTKLEHTPETDNAIPATCSNPGLSEGTHCAVCGKVLTPQKVVKATGHSYEKAITKPTCFAQGYTTYTCSVCGDSYRADYTPATDTHIYKSAVTKVSTCSDEGIRTYTCTICGDKYVQPIKKIAHKPITDKAVAATFKAAGKTAGSHCSVCGEILVAQKTIAKLGKPSLSSVAAQSKGFKASWKSVNRIDGYQIQYSTSSSFKSGNKTVTVSGYKSTSKIVKSLTAKKKYYVRIRAYKTINSKKQYSAWSSKKTVTTK